MASTTAEATTAGKSAAQMLQEQHEAHHATVEETVDEEDIQHPPPFHHTEETNNAAATSNGSAEGMMSSKAAGKQKAKETAAPVDTHDEEAFPSLGAANNNAKPPSWGSKGTLKTSATPALSSRSPSARSASPAVAGGQTINIPGQFKDSLNINSADIDRSKSIKVIIDAAKRKYKVNISVHEMNAGQVRQFTAQGMSAVSVRSALLDISKALSIERTVQFPVPESVTGIIVGKGGENIKGMQERYGVDIKIEKQGAAGSDGLAVTQVKIKGDSAGIGQVRAEISKIVNANQPKVNLPVRDIAPEFYPFLASRHEPDVQKLRDQHNLKINIPQYNQWVAQAPPRPAARGARPQFTPHGDSHITIAGEQAAALEAQLALQQLAKQLEAELMLEELTCEQVLHPYLVGDRGMSPEEFMQRTGCALIVPPGSEETDDIHIIGPANRLEEGKNLAEQLMAQKHNREIDLRKHYSEERHSRAFARYLQQKAFEKEFRDLHNAEIVFPAQNGNALNWNIISNDQQKAVSARNDLVKIAQAHPPSRMQLLDIDQFYHPHLRQSHQQSLQKDHGVLMIVPDTPGEPVVLIYEGQPDETSDFQMPRQRPTSPEQAEFERALAAAQAALMAGIPDGEIISSNMSVPRRFHDRVRRDIQQPQQEAQFPVQLNFGAPHTHARQAGQRATDDVYMRGPSQADIDAMSKAIEAIMLELEQDERERDYTTTCDFPEKHVKDLVGAGGRNIKELRNKFDCEIDTRENGKVKIQGPKKKADACAAEIVRMGKAFADVVNLSILVEPEFHGELIGAKGENLTKLQDKTGREVYIDFPSRKRGVDTPDNASQVGGNKQKPQAANEIRIRGPKAKAEKIREELLGLAQYAKDNSYTQTVSVQQDQVSSLMGKRGANMEKLRAETGADINVPNKDVDASGRVTITIKGTKPAVDKAKSEITKLSREFDSVVTKTIEVDQKYHGELLGQRGSNIDRIVTEAGGPERSAQAVQFPKRGEKGNTLTVRGTSDVVDKIVAAIMATVEDRENRVTETVDVPQVHHRNLVGTQGAERRRLESKFGVELDIPRNGSGQTLVKISGKPDAVAEAKAHIESMTKTPEGTTVMVPRHLHWTVAGDRGRLFRELNGRGIKVDHGGARPPPESRQNGTARARNMGSAAPLITDDPADAASHAFEIVHQNAAGNNDQGEIPWIISGRNADISDDQIAAVEKQIEELIAAASQPRHVGYLRLADPSMHKYVIGSNGATVNGIRRQTGCDVQVPGGRQNNNAGEEIVITGSEEDVLMARDLILEAIERAGTR